MIATRHNPFEGFPKRFGLFIYNHRTDPKSRGFRNEPIETVDFGALRHRILALQRRIALHRREYRAAYCDRAKSLEPLASGIDS